MVERLTIDTIATDHTHAGNQSRLVTNLGIVMRSQTLPVIAAVLLLSCANQSLAQSRARLAGRTESSATKTVQFATGAAQQSVAADPFVEGTTVNQGYATGGGIVAGYMPGDCGAVCGAGSAFGHATGYCAAGMSRWPGVPACCDPWIGYCGEPRCNACQCGKGRFLYYHCPPCGCGPELLSWQRGDWAGKCYRPAATCYGGQCGAGTAGCAQCQAMSYHPAAEDGEPAPASDPLLIEEPAPAGPVVSPPQPPVPPRNELPKKTSGPTVRRATESPTT